MKPFSRQELIAISLIVLIVFGFTFKGLVEAQRRSRDSGRRSDLGTISDALYAFYGNYGFFPPSADGKIKMCKGENFDSVLAEIKESKQFDFGKLEGALRECEWGKDSLTDILDNPDIVYLEHIPVDPKDGEGIKYLYLSNTRRYQIYSYLEGGEDEDGYNKEIVVRSLLCGTKICNFGKSFAETPLNISIEEYERQLDVPVR